MTNKIANGLKFWLREVYFENLLKFKIFNYLNTLTFTFTNQYFKSVKSNFTFQFNQITGHDIIVDA